MNPLLTLNRALVFATAAGLVGGALLFNPSRGPAPEPFESGERWQVARALDASGAPARQDSQRQLGPMRRYERIVSASLASTEILDALVERDRIAAFFRWSQQNQTTGYRYADKPGVDSVRDLENIIAQRPDLVVYNAQFDPPTLARLSELGIATFDLGPMLGVDSFLNQAATLATLVGVEARLETWLSGFERRLQSVACHANYPEVSAVIVSAISGSFYGGTRGTAYADILRYAHVQDAAARDYQGWPHFSPEQLLALNPDWIISTEGGRDAICTHGALTQLRACRRDAEQVLEVPASILDDVGQNMLRATELVHDGIHGACAPR